MTESSHDERGPILDRDLICIGCEYNLRALSPTGRCPECGLPIAATLRARAPLDLVRSEQARTLYPIAVEIGCSVDGVMFIADVIRMALQSAREKRPHTRIIYVDELLETFRDYARGYFNDAAEGRELLTEWGVATGERVLRIAHAQIALRARRAFEIERPGTLPTFGLDDVFPPVAR